MNNLSQAELHKARQRIRSWPPLERLALTRMTPDEAEAIVLLTALLDLRPVLEIPEGAIEP